MPRSSRHKTQRSRKHGDGELEGDASSRDRRVKQEDKDSAARVSVKSLSSKDLVLTSNGGEKKRKDRGEGSVVVVVDDRWNGGAEDEQVGEKKPKGEVFEGVDSEKGKGKGSESKSRSSRRQDGLSEGGESAKPKTEKESSRRDSSGSQYKSSKEREKDFGKDVKERDRDYSKESKERERDHGRDVKEKDRDHSKDAKEKEKERDHSKDAKEKEKERDHGKDVKEKDRDHSKDAKEKERDRDHCKDVKERERDYNKDAKEKEKDRDYIKDAKEKNRDYNKDAKEKDRDYGRDAKEKERDYSRDVKEDRENPKDAKERDRENSRDAKERDRENPRDAKERDREREAKERDKDYVKDAKERDKDYAKDAKEKDRDYAKEREKDHLKDAKDREKDHLKDAKDREKDYPKDPKERDKDHVKDPREREKDHPKDVKERDAKERDPKERDRDHHKEVKDRDREYYKEDRDRDHYKDVKDRDRENYKDVKERDKDYPKDARERNRDYTRDTKEREKDYKDPRDRDREYYRDPRERDRDYKDARERERGPERDKRVQDARHERSDDLASRKQSSKISTSGDEHVARKNTDIAGGKTQEGLRNPEPDKELDKSIKRRDGSGDKARYVGDVRDNDDRRFSSRDDHTKNSSNKDEGQREGRYRDRYREDLDRDLREHDDRVRDEHTSREHNNSKSGSKHFRDENRFPEGHYKKSKIQETDHGTSLYIDDHGAKPRVTKEPHDDVEKYASSTGKLDPRSDRGRIDYLHADKVDSSLGRPKSSPSAGNHSMKDQFRASSKQGGPSGRMPSSEEKLRLNTASRGDNVAVSGFHERDPEAWSSEKRRPKEGFRSAEIEHAAHYDRATKSDARPSHLAQKSPSTGGDRRFPDRTGARRSFDIEGHKSNNSKHGRDYLNTNRDRGMPFEKSMSNDHFRGEKFDSEPNPPGLPLFNRTSHLPGSSPGHLPPPPVIGHVTGGPSLLGTYEDDNRVQSGDRKPGSRFRRSGDHGMGRGQGNAWKSPSTWQSPVANGFMSLQHGSPHPGFHSSVQQFSSPLYGVTPSMELNHSYMHDAPDRFANHVRPFGWHNPMDDCPPRMPVWDGRNGGFVDDPHMYGRPEWDMNRQMMSNRGWEMTPDMWKGQNGNMNMELPMPQESEYSAGSEAWNGQTGPQSHKERDPSECLPTVNSEVQHSNEKSPVNTGVECPQKNLREKTIEPSKPTVPETIANGNGKILVCCNYLSKLDISLDLAQSDLYQECISLLGTKDKTDLTSNISKEERAQNKKGGLIVAAQRNNILSSVFPSGTDDVFQRAMSLYKKHSGRKAKTISSRSPSNCAEQKGSSEVDEQTTSVDTPVEDKMMIVDNQTSSEGSLAKADSASSFGEGKGMPIDREASEAMEKQSDCIADALHFVEGSQTCETIMAECRVNVSRIHLSPGSTH